jgi:hypothetical protein
MWEPVDEQDDKINACDFDVDPHGVIQQVWRKAKVSGPVIEVLNVLKTYSQK